MALPEAYKKYRDQMHERHGYCGPYRLGVAVGEAGDDLPSPYEPGSKADNTYINGLEYGRLGREIDAKAQQLYEDQTANEPVMHCHRFPAWSELSGSQRWKWREKAIEALASSTAASGVRGNVEDAIYAARNSAFEAAALKCDELADLREQGAGDSPPGHRLRQAARNIRAMKHDLGVTGLYSNTDAPAPTDARK